MCVHPLADTVARLDSWFDVEFGTPMGPGWCSLAETTDLVGGWLDRLPASGVGLRNVAAAGTSLKLANCVLRPLMALLHAHGRFPDITAADIFVHRQDDGIFDRLALAPVSVVALVGSPGVRVVSGPAELVAHAAGRIYDVFSPVVQAIRLNGRHGPPGLWGGVSDMIGGHVAVGGPAYRAAAVARLGRSPTRHCAAGTMRTRWNAATRLTDRPLAAVIMHFPTDFLACRGRVVPRSS